MNDNTSWIPLHDSLPDTATTPESASDYLLSQWFESLEHDNISPRGGDDRRTNMDLQHPHSAPDEYWQHCVGVRQQDAPKPPPRDEMLSPLALHGMQQLLPFRNALIPPTPPLPKSSLPPTTSPNYAYSSLTPAQAISPTSPSIPYFPMPTYYNVPNGQHPTFYASPPSQHLPSYEGSPGGASVSSYRSLGQTTSPGQASVYYSLPPSPATVYYTPMQAGPSTLLDLPSEGWDVPSFNTPSTPTPLPRVCIEQTIQYTHHKETGDEDVFMSGGVRGVLVRDVLKDRVALDGHDEPTVAGGVDRSIHLVIAWPGYKHKGHYISLKNSGVKITRGKLAKTICKHISSFMNGAAKTRVQRKHAQWAIGPRGITIDRLWLVSLAKAQKSGVWLAGLEMSP
ncbi:hypothetical protein VTO73DRAFT_14126 [Trametes versicolor]